MFVLKVSLSEVCLFWLTVLKVWIWVLMPSWICLSPEKYGRKILETMLKFLIYKASASHLCFLIKDISAGRSEGVC